MSTTGFSAERIATALDTFRDFHAGRSRRPLVSMHVQPTYRQVTDDAQMAEMAFAVIKADGERGETAILPTVVPDFGTVSMASLWGGELMPGRDGGGIHIKPVCATIDDLATVRTTVSFADSFFGRGLRVYRQVQARCGDDPVFVRFPDPAGPLNTLAELVDQTSLMEAMMERPEVVEAALAHVTDVIISTHRRFRAEAGHGRCIGAIWPYVYLPDDVGVALTQDYMPLIGPKQYERFEIPCLRRIADTFGGVWIHCCGQYARHLPALARSSIRILGMELHHPYTDPVAVHKALPDAGLTPYVGPTAGDVFPTLDSYAKHLAGLPCATAKWWFASCHEWGDSKALYQATGRLGPAASAAA